MFNWFKKKEEIKSESILEEVKPETKWPVILSESKLKPTTCVFCKTVYIGKPQDLQADMFSITAPKRILPCPICHTHNMVEFEEGEGFDVDKLQEAIRKRTKTHPILLPENKNTGSRHIVCPHCRYLLRVDGKGFSTLMELHMSGQARMYLPNNCQDCGQALDWSSLTEEENTDGNI